ncbi:hypothetical protein E2C01_095480 [Portunus trituberculatus]|uniref:Uncharacterized protein n=1 Tax=Portunus trituberculatus TaxID=210409 RepID=A0A5B7JPX7_PORTR|nr:hypothetical protein [Portunus trituberculatus]
MQRPSGPRSLGFHGGSESSDYKVTQSDITTPSAATRRKAPPFTPPPGTDGVEADLRDRETWQGWEVQCVINSNRRR